MDETRKYGWNSPHLFTDNTNKSTIIHSKDRTMHMDQIEKYFPELSSLPRDKQEEILERARYETFLTKGSNASWARSLVISLFIGLVVGATLGILLVKFFDIELYWVGGIAGACGGLSNHFHNKRYIKQIRPKVHELFQGLEI